MFFWFSRTARYSVLFCADPAFTVSKRKLAVTKDWYQYHLLLTARTGPGCKHKLVPVPVWAFRQSACRRRREPTTTGEDRTARSSRKPEKTNQKTLSIRKHVSEAAAAAPPPPAPASPGGRGSASVGYRESQGSGSWCWWSDSVVIPRATPTSQIRVGCPLGGSLFRRG